MGKETKQKHVTLMFIAVLLFLIFSAVAIAGPETPVEPEPKPKIEMVYVKGGCYEMGDITGDIWARDRTIEKPVHTVCVDDFYIGKYEVTQKQWTEVMGSNNSYFKGCNDCPVESLSWDDAQEFIKRLNRKTGSKYRLPTEAEWEYAARSGGKNEKWAGTNSMSALYNYAWYYDNSEKRTHPVGQKKPNGLGLYDMNGNVWEWVNDWADENYYRKSPKDNPKGPETGQYRVARGGSWSESPWDFRTSGRSWDTPGTRSGLIGFRLAASPD